MRKQKKCNHTMKKWFLILSVLIFNASCFWIGFYLMTKYSLDDRYLVITMVYCMSAGILMWEGYLYIEKQFKK